MNKEPKQSEFWSGEFGKDYTDRNSTAPQEWDDFYVSNFGLTKLEINAQFIENIPKEAKILEVGCNTGMQLEGLQRMGYKNLYGIELQPYAVEKAKEYVKEVNIVCASGFEIPFKDEYFDVVCTNGVLIHISPDNLNLIMDEMYRCSKRYIWGFEYYAEDLTPINYRGNFDYLWKADYAKLFLDRFDDLQLVKKEFYPYKNTEEEGNQDSMYLLEKQ